MLARFADREITSKDLDDQVARLGPGARSAYATPESKKRLLQNLVRFEVLAAEAKARGYDRDPAVQQTFKNQMIAALLQREVDDKVNATEISEADVERYYAEHAGTLRQPEAVRVSQVFTTERAVADKVAAAARAKGKAPRFGDLVAKYSDDQDSKRRGGDLGFLDSSSTAQPRRLVEAAFRLKEPDEVSPVVETEKGFHVLVLTERRTMFTRPLREVEDEIRRRIVTERRTRGREELSRAVREKMKVQVFEDRLDQPAQPPPAARP